MRISELSVRRPVFATVLSMMLTGPSNRCCSGIPRTWKNPENSHGLLCDTSPSRGVLYMGQVYAHEMGHHWSLAHTHAGYYDVADGQDPTYDADAAAAWGEDSRDFAVVR